TFLKERKLALLLSFALSIALVALANLPRNSRDETFEILISQGAKMEVRESSANSDGFFLTFQAPAGSFLHWQDTAQKLSRLGWDAKRERASYREWPALHFRGGPTGT